MSLDEFTRDIGVVPDLTKIDVEDPEPAVIDGAARLLSDAAPTTFMKYTPSAQADLEGLIDRLRSTFSTFLSSMRSVESFVR